MHWLEGLFRVDFLMRLLMVLPLMTYINFYSSVTIDELFFYNHILTDKEIKQMIE